MANDTLRYHQNLKIESEHGQRTIILNESEFYKNAYSQLQQDGFQGWFIRKTHKNLEKFRLIENNTRENLRILEVGGNIGEHVPYVEKSYSEYILTDYRSTNPIINLENVRFKQEDVLKLTFSNQSFDRTIATCVLHHVKNVEQAISEMRRVTVNNGLISILLPCDPGMAYRLAKRIGPNRKWKKLELTSEPWWFHYQQHPNHFPAIMTAVEQTFSNDELRVKFWPFRFKSWNFNLFATIQVRIRHRY